MNERIRELARQAGAQGLATRDFIDVEKFARLIVQECADIADINAHQHESPGSYVRQHFGIKS